MRLRTLLVALPIPLLPLACFSSNDSPGHDAGLDAATPMPEAAVPEASPMPEGAVPDATVEASLEASAEAAVDAPFDAGPPVVVVRVLSFAGPEPGVTVLFSDAQGNAIGTAPTDATGTAALVVPAGSQATALLGDPATGENLVTFVAVEPGDVLTVFDSTLGVTSSANVSSLPASPPPTTTYYQANAGPCVPSASFTSPPAPLSLDSTCVSTAGTFPMLVTAYDASGEVGYTFQNGNVISTDGGVADVSLTRAWATPGTEQVTGTNPPVGGDMTAVFSEVADGVPYTRTQHLTLDPDGGPTAATFSSHPGYPDFVQAEVSNLTSGSGCNIYIQAVAQRGAAVSPGAAFDVSRLLPTVIANSIDRSTPGRPTATWGALDDGGAPALASASGTFVALDWTAASVDGGPTQGGSWTLVVPPGAASVTVPALTGALAAWAPASNAFFSSSHAGYPVVITVKGDALDTYAKIRSIAGPLAPRVLGGSLQSGAAMTPPLPVDGTLWMTVFYTTPC